MLAIGGRVVGRGVLGGIANPCHMKSGFVFSREISNLRLCEMHTLKFIIVSTICGRIIMFLCIIT